MFFRFLGKLFFYIWVIPVLSSAIKIAYSAFLKIGTKTLTEIAEKQNNNFAKTVLEDPANHPPLV